MGLGEGKEVLVVDEDGFIEEEGNNRSQGWAAR
jgi:hypothetical protein